MHCTAVLCAAMHTEWYKCESLLRMVNDIMFKDLFAPVEIEVLRVVVWHGE